MKGKNTCRILKEIRRQIAEQNDIELITSECTYQGDCLGTCPKCESELRYLERELEKRQRLGKAAVVTGLGVSTLLGMTACGNTSNNSVPDGEKASDTFIVPLSEDNIVDTVAFTDTINSQSDSIAEKDKKCPAKIVNDIQVVGGIEDDDYVIEGESSIYDDDQEPEYYMVVEQMPEFPGGLEMLNDYLKENIKYPEAAKEAGVEGRVFVSFIVDLDGRVSNVKAMRGIGGGCDEEAVRVVESMPKWKPGIHKGKVVRVAFNLPIYFKL